MQSLDTAKTRKLNVAGDAVIIYLSFPELFQIINFLCLDFSPISLGKIHGKQAAPASINQENMEIKGK
jgi:hypothetical protein